MIDAKFEVLNIIHRMLNKLIEQSLNHKELALLTGNEVHGGLASIIIKT